MAFGFDPRLILAQSAEGPTPNETLRTIADLAQSRMQQQVQGATLADLLRQRDERQTLADIYRQNAGQFSNPLAAEFARGGFGEQASEAEARAAQQEMAKQQFMATLKQRMEERAHRDAQLGETKRHNRAMEARPPGGGIPVVITGEGGAQYLVDKRNPGSAVPVTDAQGRPIMKPKAAPTLSSGERDELQGLAAEADALRSLAARFKDEYAGGPWASAKTTFGQVFGGAAPESAQRAAEFWADYSKLLDLPERNAIFGASLSAGEKASWEGAKNVRPGVDPKIARKKFAEMLAIVERKKDARAESLKEEGFRPGAVDKLAAGAETAPVGGPARISSDEEYNALPSGTEFIGPDNKRRRKP